MITMEKLISSTNEGTDILADSIISLMKKAYECGYEEGYAAGHSERRGLLADDELDTAFRDGEQAGYIAGREDGYDEACMDLTDNDLGSSLEEEDENCGECFGASFNDCDECRRLVPDPDCQWT